MPFVSPYKRECDGRAARDGDGVCEWSGGPRRTAPLLIVYVHILFDFVDGNLA